MTTLRVLRSFLKTAEIGSVSRAAEELRVAQPALSKLIRNLEKELGTHLFHRTGRGMILTEAGASFSRELDEILKSLDRALASVRNHGELLSGVLRVGILPSQASFASNLVVEVNRRYPDIQLVLLEGYSSTICRHIFDGELDFGFVYHPERFSGLDAVFRFREDAFLFGRRPDWPFGSEVETRELASVPIITSGQHSLLRQKAEAACRSVGVKMNVTAEILSDEVQKQLITMGRGTAILPKSFIWEEVAAGTFAASRIVNPSITLDSALVSANWTAVPKCATAVVDVIEDMIQAYSAEARWVGELLKS